MTIRTFLILAAACLGLAIAQPANAQLYGGPGTERAGFEPGDTSKMGEWQILALSPSAGKDAWVSQSMKEDRLAGYNDALYRCNNTLKRMKLPQRDCVAFASKEWVASYYCREGKGANFGEGATPAIAMNKAIEAAGDSKYCEFKAVRGPGHGMELMTKPWQVTCSCGAVNKPQRVQGWEKVDSAVLGVNNAYTDCRGKGRFQVVELSLAP